MILHDSPRYRIQKYRDLPKRYCLDRKVKDGHWTHLINIGWYEHEHEAWDALYEALLEAIAERLKR